MPEYENLLNEYDELAKNNSASSKSGSAFGALDNNKKGDSPLNNIKKKAGSAAMQAMGVPKPLANMAANKLGKNNGLGNTPNALKNRRTNMPGLAPGRGANGAKNNRDDSANNSSKTGNSTGNPMNSMINSNQEAAGTEKSIAQRAAEGVATKGASTAMQAAGVPKFIADGLAKKFGEGPGLKILLIGIGTSVFFFFLIIVLIIYIWFLPVLKGLELIGDVKEGMGSFMDSAENWFAGNGWCANEAECEANAEEKFYDKVKDLSNKYSRIDMSLVMSSVLYGYNSSNGMFDMGNYCDENEDGAVCEEQITGEESGAETYKEATDNLSKVARKLSKGVEEYDEYMVKTFIPKHYSDMMKQTNKTAEQILKEIYLYSKFFESFRKINAVVSGAGICTYTFGENKLENPKVRLLACNGSSVDYGEPLPNEELIDLETYVLGTVYQEIGIGAPDEAIKAQAVAVRSFILTRSRIMGNSYNLGNDYKNNIINIRACTDDQAFCNPNKGCWSNGLGGEGQQTIHSGYDNSKYWSKAPLDDNNESHKKFKEIVASTAGVVAYKASGDIAVTSFMAPETERFKTMANQGLDYVQILKKEYSETNYNLYHASDERDIVSSISQTTCTAGLSGDWDTWKQWDSKWGSIKMGTSSKTISDVGCLVTSISIQIARSGTAIYLPAGEKEFNPGVFVKYNPEMFSSGSAGYAAVDTWRNSMAPGFKLVGVVKDACGSKTQKINKVAEYINKGYYLVTLVKYEPFGEHWVAVTGTSSDDILISDPGYADRTELFAYYGWQGANSNCLTSYVYERID